MYIGSWKIDDNLTFAVNTHTPSTGAQTDADAVPSYHVYEDETATPLITGTMAKLNDANTTGYYSEQIALTAANGFEKGKSYNILIFAAVGGVTGGTNRNFQIEAEVDANRVSDKTGYLISGTITTLDGLNNMSATGTAMAVWNADATGYQIQGSFGQAVGDPGADTDTIFALVNSIQADTDNLQTRVPAALVGGRMDASVGAMEAGVVTAAAVGTGAIDADALAADASAEIADAVWDEDATGHQTQGSFGQAIGDPGSDTDTIFALVNGIQADTDDIQNRLPAALVSGRIDASVGAMAAGVVTAAAIATDAIDADAIADNAIDAGAIATDAITSAKMASSAISEIAVGVWGNASRTLTSSLDPTAADIADAVWDEDATAHQTQGTFGQAIGDPGADTDTIFALVNTIQDDTNDIQNRLPGALVSGRMDSQVSFMVTGVVTSAAMAADSIGASELAADAVAEIAAAVNTEVDTALADIHLDHLLAVDYDPASKPGVATALLNELIESDAGVSRFTANALEQAPSGGGGGPTAAEIADAVWDEDATAHQTQGTFGQAIGDPVADTDTIFALVNSIQSDTDNIQTRLPGTLVDGRMDSHVGFMATGVVTAAAVATDAIGSAEFAQAAADKVWASAARSLTSSLDPTAAQINAEVDAAIETYHLDHLLAADYDPANKPGVATALLNELIESDAGVSQFTANALEEAPSGGGGGGGSTAEDIWSYESRTLTQSAASVLAAVTGEDIAVARGTTWSISLTNIGALTNYDTVYLTVKESDSHKDTQAILKVYNHATTGLIRFNGAAPISVANGKITITDIPTGDITITVQEAETVNAIPGEYLYDIKGVDNDGNVDLLSSGGKFTIVADITRAITSP